MNKESDNGACSNNILKLESIPNIRSLAPTTERVSHMPPPSSSFSPAPTPSPALPQTTFLPIHAQAHARTCLVLDPVLDLGVLVDVPGVLEVDALPVCGAGQVVLQHDLLVGGQGGHLLEG